MAAVDSLGSGTVAPKTGVSSNDKELHHISIFRWGINRGICYFIPLFPRCLFSLLIQTEGGQSFT